MQGFLHVKELFFLSERNEVAFSGWLTAVNYSYLPEASFRTLIVVQSLTPTLCDSMECIIKAIYNKGEAYTILRGEKLIAFTLRSGLRQRCSFMSSLCNIVLKILATAVRQ